MTAGRVHPTADKITAKCAHCPWTVETVVPGMAAKMLLAHNAEEHS